jgi:multicomponent Na+:H+ antiporter subunit D
VFKGLLFMTMGAVLQQTGRIGGNELGGLWRTMPKTTGLCLVGAASISAFPLFSGFVSKSMVMTAALELGHGNVWLLLLFASAGVFHHAGIKIPYFAFFGHDSGIRTADPPRNMLAAMFIAASLCIVIGVFPERTLYRLLPFATAYTPFDVTHVVTQTQLLFFGALAFVALQKTGIYPAELRSVNLDADWLWRRAAPAVSRPIADAIAGADHAVRGAVVDTLAAGLRTAERSQGLLARSWPTGSMVLWVAVLLAAYLLLHLV